ncbi:DUF2730 family protein [Sedimentitalea sp. JM2-8]|uniref:DUF2730 family protein n=1 Tax=Sedimentitalea xiamensis TaxID=3050037 RepID=A0ABT7FD56_9RHOB|nr:DUF2730 family protein [Sedimentitalea xiamensis]MDK3072749.1 DUF2730 family protein [Sedimentitalea xiamensis]
MNLTFDWTVTMPLLFSVAALFIAWFRTRRQDVDERFRAGTKRMDQHDLDIQRLQHAVDAMPAKDEVHRLEMLLVEMGGDMKAMRVNMKSVADSQSRLENIVGRHEDHLRGTP